MWMTLSIMELDAKIEEVAPEPNNKNNKIIQFTTVGEFEDKKKLK